jgi:hypothetical protein
MSRRELKQKIEQLAATLDVSLVEQALNELLCQGEDVGGGINAFRLICHLLGEPSLTGVEVVWAYRYLKPPMMAAVEQLPAYEFVEGD